MDPLIILVFVLLVGFIFVLLTRWQRSSDKNDAAGCCGGHQHGPDCDHQHDHHHHDHKDGGCCGGKH